MGEPLYPLLFWTIVFCSIVLVVALIVYHLSVIRKIHNSCIREDGDVIPLSELSENTHAPQPPKGREYRIVVLPKDMVMTTVTDETGEYELPLNKPDAKTDGTKTVVMIDDFCCAMPVSPIHRMKREGFMLTHGEWVGKVLTNGIEDSVRLVAISVREKSDLKGPDTEAKKKKIDLTVSRRFNQALEDVLKMVQNGTRVDAVNLSYGTDKSFYGLEELTQIRVQENTFNANRYRIIAAIEANEKGYYLFPGVAERIKRINALVDSGVKVYKAAGNGNEFSLECLSRAFVVDSEDCHDSEDNTRIPAHRMTKGKFVLYPVFQKRKFLGYAGDGLRMETELFAKPPRTSLGHYTITGTSLATPYALNLDVKVDLGLVKPKEKKRLFCRKKRTDT